jgi:hypothetical protein
MKQKNELQVIQVLVDDTLRAICKDQREKVIRLYAKTEQLFNKGTDYTRSLITSIFILPLSQYLALRHNQGKEYLNLLPTQLQSACHRQINSPCI